MKHRRLEGFGKRLVRIRKGRGLTQAELGGAVGVSKRVIAYYEHEEAQPPGALLVDLARALQISADELLGLEPVRETPSPRVARLFQRLARIEELPRSDQQAVLKMLDAFLLSRGLAGEAAESQ